MIAKSIAELGFKVEDVRRLLITQAHFDYNEGMAEMKRITGARMLATAPDAGSSRTAARAISTSAAGIGSRR
jgi:metallo-beta-lactamase class B